MARGSRPPSEQSGVLVERDGSTVWLTLDRPAARNALNEPMRRGLRRALRAADADPEVTAVVLTGRDPAFCAGLDLHESLTGTPASREYPDPAAVLRAVRVPVICAVNGACYTGALEMALSCSFLLASDRASFADTHATIGLIAGWGMSALLPRAVGVRRARQMMLTGEPIGAPEALRCGLVNEVLPHEQLLPRVREVADRIARSHQPAARVTLDLLDATDGVSLGHALAAEADAKLRWRSDPAEITRRFRVSGGRAHPKPIGPPESP
jgi:enoyl-CoA hydratase